MTKMGQYDEEGVKLDEFDPWEHLYEEEDDNFGKIKTPKVKKMKKDKEFSKSKKRRRIK